MLKEINDKYKNITRSEVMLFLSLCESCQQKQKRDKKGVVTNPIVFKELNSLCQVDLINYQSQPDNTFKFLMVYQDHLTKSVMFRALESKKAEELARHLVSIFSIFGAPAVLQSDNGREFANKIIESLKDNWLQLNIVHGKPRHSQSQGNVERANQDVENMITTWLQDHHSVKWSESLNYVQFMKNCTLHSGIKTSPYEAMFGCKPKVGLKTCKLPQELLENICTEEELENLIKTDKTEIIAKQGDSRNKNVIKINDERNDLEDEKIVCTDDINDLKNSAETVNKSSFNEIDNLVEVANDMPVFISDENGEVKISHTDVSCAVCNKAAYNTDLEICSACSNVIHSSCNTPKRSGKDCSFAMFHLS